ncbi:isochorismatase family protein [Sulfurovum sp. CS9]|uniref:isochorismatase family protein n=1 Tax=Sulfurovum sp. CS9 TaxID=3391146 RepID=UPI0039E988A4
MIKQWKRPENLFLLNAQKAAFVIIDMQNFSCVPIGRDPLPHINTVIQQINKLADFCRELHIPVIWVRHNLTMTNLQDDSGLFKLFHDKNHMNNTINLDKGTEIYAAIHFDSVQDHIIFKNRYSAFLSDPPELHNLLEKLKKNQLLIAGIAANVCVESTLRDAMQLDYEVILVSDGITAINDAVLENTLSNTYNFFGDVRTAENIIQEFNEHTP